MAMLRVICVSMFVGLAGCAELGARAITDATYLAESAEAYVREVHEVRREIRRRCREILWQQIDKLMAEGNYNEARRVMDEQYPDLFTVGLYKAYRSDGLERFDHPWGCSQPALPTLNPETGLLEGPTNLLPTVEK